MNRLALLTTATVLALGALTAPATADTPPPDTTPPSGGYYLTWTGTVTEGTPVHREIRIEARDWPGPDGAPASGVASGVVEVTSSTGEVTEVRFDASALESPSTESPCPCYAAWLDIPAAANVAGTSWTLTSGTITDAAGNSAKMSGGFPEFLTFTSVPAPGRSACGQVCLPPAPPPPPPPSDHLDWGADHPAVPVLPWLLPTCINGSHVRATVPRLNSGDSNPGYIVQVRGADGRWVEVPSAYHRMRWTTVLIRGGKRRVIDGRGRGILSALSGQAWTVLPGHEYRIAWVYGSLGYYHSRWVTSPLIVTRSGSATMTGSITRPLPAIAKAPRTLKRCRPGAVAYTQTWVNRGGPWKGTETAIVRWQ